MQTSEICQYFTCDEFLILKPNASEHFDFGPVLTEVLGSIGYDTESFQHSMAELNKTRGRAVESYQGDFPFRKVFEYIFQVEDIAFRLADYAPFEHLVFRWSGSIDLRPRVSGSGLNYELINVYYNLGVFFRDHAIKHINTQFDVDGYRRAYNCFAFAASIFSHISRNHALFGIDDACSGMFQLFSKAMLAHAQEIAAYKAALDSKTFRLLAKLLTGAANMYKDCIKDYSNLSDQARGHIDTSWSVTFNARMKLMASLSELAQMNHDLGVSKYSTAMARLQLAINHCTECIAYLGAWFPPIVAQLYKQRNFAQSKLAELKRDNDFIYHQSEVPFSELEMIESVVLASGLAFEALKQELGISRSTPIFSNIVPSGLVEDVSKFTEERTKLLRFEEDKLEKALGRSAAVFSKLSIAPDDHLLDSLNYMQRIKKRCESIFELMKRSSIVDLPLKYTDSLLRSIDGSEKLDRIIEILEREESQRASSQEVFLSPDFVVQGHQIQAANNPILCRGTCPEDKS